MRHKPRILNLYYDGRTPQTIYKILKRLGYKVGLDDVYSVVYKN